MKKYDPESLNLSIVCEKNEKKKNKEDAKNGTGKRKRSSHKNYTGW